MIVRFTFKDILVMLKVILESKSPYFQPKNLLKYFYSYLIEIN